MRYRAEPFIAAGPDSTSGTKYVIAAEVAAATDRPIASGYAAARSGNTRARWKCLYAFPSARYLWSA